MGQFHDIYNTYRKESFQESDIVFHLPTLEHYASLCSHVTEFGVRTGKSTVALIMGCKGEVHSYDIDNSPMVRLLQEEAENLPCKWTFHQGDTSVVTIEETDMLFIDTEHTYAHVKKELATSGRKARRFLAFHDIISCPQIVPAIDEFLNQYENEYTVVHRTTQNNGFLVLERVSPHTC